MNCEIVRKCPTCLIQNSLNYVYELELAGFELVSVTRSIILFCTCLFVYFPLASPYAARTYRVRQQKGLVNIAQIRTGKKLVIYNCLSSSRFHKDFTNDNLARAVRSSASVTVASSENATASQQLQGRGLPAQSLRRLPSCCSKW